jgi:hypothetical protein
MKQWPLLIFLLALGPVLPASAAEPNTVTPEERAAGWKLLFDGHSFTGWHLFKVPGSGHGGWKIEEGALVCPKSNGRPNGSGGDLTTDGKFSDFEFSFEWRISAGGNSGVHYLIDESRPPTKTPLYAGDTGKSPVGFEYQILDDEKHPDAKRGPTHMAGALYDMLAAEKKTLKTVGEWNEGRIVVRGKHIEQWLNGGKTAECDLDSPAYREAFTKSKYHVVEGFGTKAPTPLALQDHGEEVAFRSLKIRELK